MSLRLAATILLCAALYLIGNARVQLWDRDEPRYAQASRQMLASGDWVVPQLLDEPRLKKPPLIYWLQAASMRWVSGIAPMENAPPRSRMQRDAFAARLPSAVAMTLMLVGLAVVLHRWVGEERAFWTVLIFGTSGLVTMAAKMSLTDAVLLCFVTTFQLCVYSVYKGKGSWLVVFLMGASLGLAALAKGPVVLGVAASTIVALVLLRWIDRWRDNQHTTQEDYEQIVRQTVTRDFTLAQPKPWSRWILKSAVILVIAAALILPWVVALQRRMPGSLWATVRYEVFERMAKPMEQHKGPPGYYLLSFLITFFPWSLMLPTAIKLAWQHRRVPLVRFSLAAVVGPWLMFEAIQTKLPHYVLPCIPFLAFLTADALFRCMRRRHEDWHKRGWLVAVGAWSAILILLGLAPWAAVLADFSNLPYAAMSAVSLVAVIGAVLVFIRFKQLRIGAAAYAMAGTMILLMTLLFAWYLPAARFLHLSEDVGHHLQVLGAARKGDVLMLTHKESGRPPIDYKEDSLPFYQGGTIRTEPHTGYLEKTPPEHWPRYVVLTRQIWEHTPPHLRDRLEVLHEFKGLAYASRGRVVEVLIARKRQS